MQDACGLKYSTFVELRPMASLMLMRIICTKGEFRWPRAAYILPELSAGRKTHLPIFQ